MGTSSIAPDVSERIRVLRYAMILGIVVLHMPPHQSLEQLDNTGFDLLKGFLSHGVFRATTPVLTAIAGFLLFRSGLDMNPAKLLRSKSNSLVVPLLVFNLPLVVLLYFLQSWNGGTAGYRVDLTDPTWTVWANATFGLFDAPVNYPTNFLRDLFVLCLLAPQLGMLLRNLPWIGLVAVAVVALTGMEGKLILRDTMLINFYVGGMAALWVDDLKALDRYGHALLAVFLLWCLAIPAFNLANRTIFVLCAPLLIWPAVSVVMGSAPARWLARNSSASFFTFLTHGPLLLVVHNLQKSVLGQSFAGAAGLALPICTAAFCLLAYRLLSAHAPAIGYALGEKPA